MNVLRIRDQIRQRIERLQIVYDELGAFTNGNGHARAITNADVALDMLKTTDRRRGPRPTHWAKPGPKKDRKKRPGQLPAFRSRPGGTLPDVTVPKGLTLADTAPSEATLLALKAVKKPLRTDELTALLIAAGAKLDIGSMPPMRYVGLLASGLVKERKAKKTANGWTAR